MNVRKNGFVLIAGSLAIFLGLSEWVTRYLEESRRDIHEARLSYIRALSQTRVQLANHLYDIAHDPVLISNLAGKLSYSISRTLEGEIHPGTFDFYVVFDEN